MIHEATKEQYRIDKKKNCFVIDKKEYPPTQHNLEIYYKLLLASSPTEINDLIERLSTVVLDI